MEAVSEKGAEDKILTKDSIWQEEVHKCL